MSHTVAYVNGPMPGPGVLPSRRMKARDAAKAETREALLEAGMAEFAERGFDAPSLDAICARAGYTRGAFYVHFRDREHFQIAVMERVIGAWLDTIVASADPRYDLERTIDRFVDAFVRIMTGQGERTLVLGTTRFHLVLEAAGRSEIVRQRFVAMLVDGVQRVAAQVRAGQGAGSVRDDVDADQAASLLVTLVLGILSAAQTGVPLDPFGLRELVRKLMAPPRARNMGHGETE